LALIVAVVALIISGWQLAQQLFATATDGKRFCQGSVMGIWARKTRLSWRWSQIRFETKYTTPELRMTSGIVDETKTSSRAKRVAQHSRLVYRIPILGWLAEVFNGPPSDWDSYFELTSNQLDLPLEMRKTTRPDKDPVPISKAEAVSWWIVKTWDRTYSEDSPDIVSWPILLEWIYDTQIKSIRKVEPPKSNGEPNEAHDEVDDKKLERGRNKEESEPPYRTISSEEREQREDRVVVRLVERSWDLIPPDVVRWVLLKSSLRDLLHLSLFRPLAKSTVGTMIVVAHRFGMSWLGEFNPSEGKMNAAGSGHTLTSETVRGLGMILQYNNHQESRSLQNFTGSRRGLNADEYLSPTTIADKLHCGRLPIDNAAVHRRDEEQHIDLIDVTRKLDLYTFLSKLGVPNSDMETLRDHKHQNLFGSPGRGLKHSIEEAVALLCPIPTLPDSTAHRIVWPFRSFRQPYTPFRQKEGVEELRNQLSEYITASKPGTIIMADRAESSIKYLTNSPLECLDILLAAFKPLRQNRNAPTAASAQRATEIYRQIKDIHKQTSTVFAELSNTRLSDDEAVNPFLIDMAGAQIALAVKYGRNADTIAMTEGAKENLADVETRRRFVQELARLYVEDLHDSGERTIRKHLKRTGYVDKLKPGEVPALWWTAVVRCVCWFMSMQIRLPET
jgi:hypothetical protein